MNSRIKYLFLPCIVFLLLASSSINTGQEQIVQNPDEPWQIITELRTVFIGETFWINISGPDNSSFTLRFISLTDHNNTFERNYQTDEFGNYSREWPSFRVGQEGRYSIQIIVSGIIEDIRTIEIIYDEDQAQWIAIWDIEGWNIIQDEAIAQNEEDMILLWKHYEKWIICFFIPAICILIFFIMIILVSIWPVIQIWWYKDKKDISKPKRTKWTYEFITGGRPSEDFRDEFPGSMKDDEEAVFDGKDPRVTDDCDGKTEEELEIHRREKVFGKDWKKKHPYGSIPEEAFEMPKPWSRNFWKVFILSISGLVMSLAGIWFFWYILIPVGLGFMIYALLVYLFRVRKEEKQ